MAQTIRDVMTPDPVVLSASSSLEDAARAMKQSDIGDVLVSDDDGKLCGIVTDRDIVVRGLAEGRASASLGEICSTEPVAVAPNDSLTDAVRLMGEHAIRRLPVTDHGRPVGMVSLGDLALERDRESVLAEISAAPANQ
ncbi:MAG TPA: CBS domain-containing protein [Acidimicrobiia bacterium]|nr:CBS domain-containing protein [Acidimicrobiia bacterium]